ncbi:MAG: stage II sporulation protein M [Solirubrobacteraceae bacterium]
MVATSRGLRDWTAVATAITAALLLAVWVVARAVTPDPTPLIFPGLTRPGQLHDVTRIFGRNLLVLALHSMACVAGYLAGKSLPEEAARYRGVVKVVHEHAGPVAITFVSGATLFSLTTQAYVLGSGASTLAAQGGVAPGLLLVGLLPHAVPELIALFLPLAAWLLASRRGEWDQLRRATLVTTAIALPVLAAAALVEVYVSPHFVLWLRSLHFV